MKLGSRSALMICFLSLRHEASLPAYLGAWAEAVLLRVTLALKAWAFSADRCGRRLGKDPTLAAMYLTGHTST